MHMNDSATAEMLGTFAYTTTRSHDPELLSAFSSGGAASVLWTLRACNADYNHFPSLVTDSRSGQGPPPVLENNASIPGVVLVLGHGNSEYPHIRGGGFSLSLGYQAGDSHTGRLELRLLATYTKDSTGTNSGQFY